MNVEMTKWILENKRIVYYNTNGSKTRVNGKIEKDTDLKFIDIVIATKSQLLEFIKTCIEYGNLQNKK